MKILIVYRHFWPDSPPYAFMLRSIARHLVAKGHDVTIWAEQPCYKASDGRRTEAAREMLDGILVERFAPLPLSRRSRHAKLVDQLLFPPRALFKAIGRRLTGRRYDLVWTATIPPVAQGLFGRLIANLFGAKFLYHCQDLYPELAGHMGIWSKAGSIYRILARIEAKTRTRADALVTLSEDMKSTVMDLAKPRGELAVINNFMLDDFSDLADRKPSFPRNPSTIRLIFAGNLGLYQGLEPVVEAMRQVEKELPELELVLMGEGKALPMLRDRARGLGNIHFLPHRPLEQAAAEISVADFGLVSIEPDIYRVAFPSKTLTYLGLGVPLLAIVEPESRLADMICRNGLGLVAEGRTSDAIADTLRSIVMRRSELGVMKQTAEDYFDRTHALPAVLDEWAALIDRLQGPSTAS